MKFTVWGFDWFQDRSKAGKQFLSFFSLFTITPFAHTALIIVGFYFQGSDSGVSEQGVYLLSPLQVVHLFLNEEAIQLIAINYFFRISHQGTDANVIQNADDNEQDKDNRVADGNFFADSQTLPIHNFSLQEA